MSRGNILSLCDYTGTFVQPWVDAGYHAECVDIQHPETSRRDGVTYISGDLTNERTFRQLLDRADRFDFVAAWPPCTDLAVSGARWFKTKGLTALVQALDLVDRCRQIAEASGAPWLLENPVSTISTYWRKPDFVFDPYMYGGYQGGQDDGYTKRTCLWTGGGFKMPAPKPIPLDELTHDRIHKAPPGPERANFRSATPAGFARAVFEANAEVAA